MLSGAVVSLEARLLGKVVHLSSLNLLEEFGLYSCRVNGILLLQTIIKEKKRTKWMGEGESL